MRTSNTISQRLYSCLFSPDEPRLRAGWRLLAQFLLMIALTIPFWLVVALIPSLPGQADFLVTQVINFMAIALSVLLARRYLDRRSFASLGLHWNRLAPKDLLLGVFISFPMMGLIFVLEWAVGWLTISGFGWESQPLSSVVINSSVMFIGFVFIAFQEELLSRGYWLQNLTAGLNLTWGALLSALLFAVAHWFNPHATWMAVLGLTLTGLLFAYSYIKTNQLWLPIGMHFGWNFFEGTLFGFQVSGISTNPIIVQSVNGPLWATGGAFGPEAGLVLIPALLVGFAGVSWYTKSRTSQLDITH